jgi:hypothetical protein
LVRYRYPGRRCACPGLLSFRPYGTLVYHFIETVLGVFQWKGLVVAPTKVFFHGKTALLAQHSTLSMESACCWASIPLFPWKNRFVGPTSESFRGKSTLFAQHCTLSVEKDLCWLNIHLFPWKNLFVGSTSDFFHGKTALSARFSGLFLGKRGGSNGMGGAHFRSRKCSEEPGLCAPKSDHDQQISGTENQTSSTTEKVPRLSRTCPRNTGHKAKTNGNGCLPICKVSAARAERRALPGNLQSAFRVTSKFHG